MKIKTRNAIIVENQHLQIQNQGFIACTGENILYYSNKLLMESNFKENFRSCIVRLDKGRKFLTKS